jgi:acetyl-CoA carboxylase biotin carboxylase subunit
MIQKVLIANRGEIALRILRACKLLKIKTVAVYSEADKDLMHVLLADEAICIGPSSSTESYLNTPSILTAADMSGADAIHPGYGFLSENSEFAKQVEDSGFIFIGPHHQTIQDMGDKISAIKLMKAAGVPCVPGSEGELTADMTKNHAIAKKLGYPVLIKASGGGGGRGMRVVHQAAELEDAIQTTKQEATAAFNNPALYMEKFLERPRHVEFQVLGDGKGHAIHLFERDCSMQRKHQKVIEEATAPGIDEKTRAQMGEICANACKKMHYRGAGTFEFLYQDDQFYFIEMNTRIQVEHPVTEMITGLDLVKLQLQIANEQPLELEQKHVHHQGHAIECRINAEDPKTFCPSPGNIKLYHPPGGANVRVDSHVYSGYTVPHHYDSMIAKIICYGTDRASAISRMQHALDELIIDGIKTNVDLHRRILAEPNFQSGEFSIHTLEQWLKST